MGRIYGRDKNAHYNKRVKIRVTEGEHEGKKMFAKRKAIYKRGHDGPVGTSYIPDTRKHTDITRLTEDQVEVLS